MYTNHVKMDTWGRENSNSKTLILKDSSVGSIWTYVTNSPCYATKRETDRQTDRQTDRDRDREGQREYV